MSSNAVVLTFTFFLCSFLFTLNHFDIFPFEVEGAVLCWRCFIMSKRPGNWSAEENLPLVVPDDLFTSSAGEEDASDLDGSFSKSVNNSPSRSLFYRICLHMIVFVAHIMPWCFVVPLLKDYTSLQSLTS
jgi:hypothetical protein